MSILATSEKKETTRAPPSTLPLSHGSGLIYTRAADIAPSIWEAAFGHARKDLDYYRLLEDTMREGFTYRYLLLLDPAHQPVALQPLILVDQDLMASIESFPARVVEFCRKFWKRFFHTRMLMAGCLVGDGSLGILAPASGRLAGTMLAEALLSYARKEGISLLAVKDFPASLRGDMTPLLAAGYTSLAGFPPLVLDLDFSSFDEYMEKRLSRITRKGLRRKLRRTDETSPPITMEVLSDCHAVIDEIYPLYLQVARRSPVEFETFTREYFLEAGRRRPDRHRYFIWRQSGKIIAFSFCTLWKDALYDNDIGLDYAIAHDLNLYYVTFRDLIVWALAHGLKRYYSAPFNYDPKLHLRLKPVEVDLYIRHTSDVINSLLKRIAPFFAPARSDPALCAYQGSPAISQGRSLLNLFANPWLQIGLNALIVTASELFLKLGARATAHLSHTFTWTGLTGLASLWTWFGIVCVILSLISWLYVLRQVPLSVAFPLSNVVHVLVPLTSRIFLHESISPRRWLGIALVLIGLIIVAKPFTRIEEKL